MLAGMNKAYLMGRTGRDAELANLPSGAPVCEMRICTPRTRKVGGTFIEDVDWHRLVGYGAIAKQMASVRKGSGIMVEAKISPKRWTDSQGHTHYGVDLIVTSVLWVEGMAAPVPGEPPPLEEG
jgi:single stranded DNA-binding protein